MGKNTRGFTLIELLIVIAILGVLVALLVFGIAKYREKGGSSGHGIETTSSLPIEIGVV